MDLHTVQRRQQILYLKSQNYTVFRCVIPWIGDPGHNEWCDIAAAAAASLRPSCLSEPMYSADRMTPYTADKVLMGKREESRMQFS